MFNWVQQHYESTTAKENAANHGNNLARRIANVAGTQEPIYGSSAIRSVAEEAKETPFTEIGRDDLTWKEMEWTNVETQTFYFISDQGRVGMAQVIYSNVAGIRKTCQFNSKIFSVDESKPHMWSSTPLNNFEISEDKASFYADDCALELSADGNSYTIKSLNDEHAIVNLKITRKAPGFQAGKTGTSSYGTDPKEPWGWMRHAFWPRCAVEGTITTTDEGAVDFTGRGFYSYALQGMKPHHAAARWSFLHFQGPSHSAVMMQFVTPPSYGCTVVNVGGIATDSAIVGAGCDNTATDKAVEADPESGWPAPTNVAFVWHAKDKDGNPVEAEIDAALGKRLDRVDVMAEVPAFVKRIVAGAVGTKPYIYQYATKATLKLKAGGKEITEEGHVFSEATFISELETPSA
ncbi:survival factor 1 [Cordyceps militaris]|uniref:Ceramide-binding protein SVF1 n=1 Tax=Cordyceps militaris TaxID=73501 RepID=A0A2H4SMB5_CORMI|nr:survival factor 1 [Cordyceps militaris]